MKKILSCIAVLFATSAVAAPVVFNAPANASLSGAAKPDVLPIVTPGDACVVVGSKNTGISANYRAIYTCYGGIWTQTEGAGWSKSVASFVNLPASGDAIGTVRVTNDTGRSFYFNGATWNPLVVDRLGNMNVPGTLQANSGAVAGAVTAGQVTAAGMIQSASMSTTGGMAAKSGHTGQTDDYGLVLYDGAGVGNVSAKSGVGSMYVNDLYIRSAGKWASQMPVVERVYSGSHTFYSSGTAVIGVYRKCVKDGYMGKGNMSSGVYLSGSTWMSFGNRTKSNLTVYWSCYS